MSFNPKTKLFLDCETTGILPFHGDRPFMVQLGDDNCNVKIYEWNVCPYTREVTPNKQDIKEIRSLVMDPFLVKESYNRKFDQRMLEMVGIGFAGIFHDCFLKARVCRTNEISYVLEDLSFKYAEYPKDDSDYVHKCAVKARAYGRNKGWKLYDFGKHPERADYWMIALAGIDPDAVRRYGHCDIERLFILSHLYEEVFKEDPARLDAYNKEMELFPTVYAMETRGIAIDPEKNRELQKEHGRLHQQYLEEAREILIKDKKVWWNEAKRGRDRKGNLKPVQPFNPASPQQLCKVIYGKQPKGYGLKCVRYTKPSKTKPLGGESSDWKALKDYQNIPVIRAITLCNGAKKGREFFDQYAKLAVPDHINLSGFCMHPSADQGGAKTLRFSYREPNLQQAAEGGGVSKVHSRGPIKPRKGYRFYLFDFAGQEVRIFAEISKITELIEAACNPEKDIMTEISNKAWGGKGNVKGYRAAANALELGNMKPQNDLVLAIRQKMGWDPELSKKGSNSKEALRFAEEWLKKFNYRIVEAEISISHAQKSSTRTKGKNVVYAKLYGGGASAVNDFLFCGIDEARVILREFEEGWPGIVDAMNVVISTVKKHGYVETIYGNKLDVDPGFEYKGINYQIQGSAAAMMKDAMRRCDKHLKRSRLDAHIAMTVHDELGFEIREGHDHPWLLRGIRNIMEDNQGRIKLLPMTVECAVAKTSWAEKEKITL